MTEPATRTGPRGVFVPLSLATTLATYLLIAVGALVRAAGAGLGCPDWPTCFGHWVPPTRASELPAGFDPGQFNAFNTWLEYVNRLTGVTIGLLIFATLIAAWRRHRRSPLVVWPTTAAFILVGFQGWLGGQVVAKGLADDVLTAHMVLALVIVGLLLYAHLSARFGRATGPVSPTQRRLALGGWAVLALVLVQTALGTRVRSALKGLENADLPRSEWLPLGWWPDLAHRQLAVIVLAASVALVWGVRRALPGHERARAWAAYALGLAAVQIASGLGLAYAGVPRALQVAHLALASLMVGALSVFLFHMNRRPKDTR